MEIRLFGVKKEQRRILEACHVDPMSGHMGVKACHVDPMSGHMGVKACHVDPMSGHMEVKRTLSRISERFPNVTSASMRIGNAFILPQNCTRFQ